MQIQASPIVEIENPLYREKGVRFLVKRDDLIHPEPSGNKWRKLYYNLLAAKERGHDTLLTFGGAYSNHIYATAAAANRFNFRAVGIIRGERIEPLNVTLSFAEKQGMQLHFIDRTTYRQRNEPDFQRDLLQKWKNAYILPEGGTNALALQGCADLVGEVQAQLPDTTIDYWASACGTGGTIGGIISGLQGKHHAIGFSVLKGDFLKKEVSDLLSNNEHAPLTNWHINTDYHFGGYAKFKAPLLAFIQAFKTQHNIQLEPIYTGKLFYGLHDLIQNDFFPQGSTLLAVHTGGLQGLEGLKARYPTYF